MHPKFGEAYMNIQSLNERPAVRDLLQGMLTKSTKRRWTLAEVEAAVTKLAPEEMQAHIPSNREYYLHTLGCLPGIEASPVTGLPRSRLMSINDETELEIHDAENDAHRFDLEWDYYSDGKTEPVRFAGVRKK